LTHGLSYSWQYLDIAFGIAKPNLRVNGRNFEDFDENDAGASIRHMSHRIYILTHLALIEIEPFDEALDRHIWSLSDQRLKWDREIARTRTEKPREVETMLQDLFDRQHEAMQDIDMAVEDKDEVKDGREYLIYPC
jgi:hypothetical protein